MRYILIYAPIPILILVLQTVARLIFPNLTHLPDLILILCVYSAHYNGRFYGQLVGAYSGLCEDILSAAPFGTHILLRSVISFILAHTGQWQVHASSAVPIILVLCALLIKYALYLVLGILFSLSNLIAFILSASILYETLYTLLATPILFSLLSLIPKPRSASELYLEHQ